MIQQCAMRGCEKWETTETMPRFKRCSKCKRRYYVRRRGYHGAFAYYIADQAGPAATQCSLEVSRRLFFLSAQSALLTRSFHPAPTPGLARAQTRLQRPRQDALHRRREPPARGNVCRADETCRRYQQQYRRRRRRHRRDERAAFGMKGGCLPSLAGLNSSRPRRWRVTVLARGRPPRRAAQTCSHPSLRSGVSAENLRRLRLVV